MNNTPIVEFRDVSVFHKERGATPVLSDVNLTVYAGQLTYITGRVGSGKSSLLKTIYGELPLRRGVAQVCGFNMAKLTKVDMPKFRRRLGVVFQEYNLLTEHSVYQNLEFVLRATDWRETAAINKRIEYVLDIVGMRDKAYKMPRQISGGERQRICIARALLNTPQLLIADEPTGNLDPTSSMEVMSLFRDIAARGCGVLLSTHNLENIRRFPSRTFHCAGGFIEEVRYF